jgi:hypothetical protein
VLEQIERTLLARLLCDDGRPTEASLELAIVEAGARVLEMPRIELGRRFVAGLVALSRDDAAGAREHWSAALALGVHVEVGFEALLPAHLALVSADERHLAASGALLADVETPGLHAALAILTAAVRGEALPAIAPSVMASSSDARRALTMVVGAGAETLRIAADGRRVTFPDGAAVDLGRRAAPRRLLLALARARLEEPGRVLGFDELIAAGWPGERMRPEAARKRLRTAIWTLRRLGLEPMLLTRDDGYLLDPFVPLQLASG